MTKLLHIFAALLLVAAASGCRRDTHALERMAHAEAMMASHPDSALAIMEAIDPGSLRPDRARALHALLLTQARDKNYIDLELDSATYSRLEDAAASLDRHNRMKAHFYLGCVNLERKDYANAMGNYTLAASEAKELRDTFFLAMAYQDTGTLYSYIYDGPQCVEYYARAMDLFRQSSQYQGYLPWAKMKYARALHNTKHFDEAITIINEILADKTKLAADTSLHEEALCFKGLALFGKEDYPECIQTFEASRHLNPEKFTKTEAFNLCKAYVYTGNIEMADSIAQLYLGNNDGWGTPASLYIAHGDLSGANEAYLRACTMRDRIISAAVDNNVNQIARRYHENTINNLSQANYNKSIIISFAVIIIILGGVTTILLLMRIRERNRRKLYEIQIYASSLAKTVQSLRNNEKLNNDRTILTESVLRDAFGMSFENINNIAKEYFSVKELPDGNKRVMRLIEKSFNSLKGEKAIERLTEHIDHCLGNLATSFKEDYPSLSQTDFNIFVYLVCGFAPMPISVFMNSTLSAISSRKSRLKSKIATSDVANKERYLQFF